MQLMYQVPVIKLLLLLLSQTCYLYHPTERANSIIHCGLRYRGAIYRPEKARVDPRMMQCCDEVAAVESCGILKDVESF